MKNNILLNTFLGVLSLFFLNACEDSLMGVYIKQRANRVG